MKCVLSARLHDKKVLCLIHISHKKSTNRVLSLDHSKMNEKSEFAGERCFSFEGDGESRESEESGGVDEHDLDAKPTPTNAQHLHQTQLCARAENNLHLYIFKTSL